MSGRFSPGFFAAAIGVLLASGSGCLWLDNDCDTVVTECFDVCDTCATRADCREDDALCLLLNPASDSGFCGRACQADADCPTDYGCRSAAGTLQCVPNDTTCSDQVPLDSCTVSSDCRTGFVCVDGFCGPPPIPCESDADCARGFTCSQGECKSAE